MVVSKSETGEDSLPFLPEDLSGRLLSWYAWQGRDLPWRHTRDPYRIWLSEIMLQQTTVAAVIDYYRRFLERFPDLQSLAAAPVEQVLEQWAGLGYYSRARNLHKAAVQVAAEHDGRFPERVELLQALPGVGRSTAGAIACLAFDCPEPILDGNVRRVLCRLLAVTEPARDRTVEQRLWRVAALLVPAAAAHDYTQAIMDLGATVCTPKQPACDDCPLAELCRARAEGLTAAIPVSKPRPKVSTRYQAILLIASDGQRLLRRRPAEGLLGGMLEFPVLDLTGGEEPQTAVQERLADYGCTEAVSVGTIRHTYSHFRLEAEVFVLDGCREPELAAADLFWQADADLDRLALHGAHKKALALGRAAKD